MPQFIRGCLLALAFSAAHAATTPPAALKSILTADGGARTATRSALRYDYDYPDIGYGEQASQNAVARLQARIDRGEAKLTFHPTRGYLDSVLKELGIEVSSQTLVYSKTSLQIDLIRAATPRAIYFNDDTYVAWVPHTSSIEIVTMDSAQGQVFYTLVNTPHTQHVFERETTRCLSCHDTFGLSGGGVPRFLFMSSLVDVNGEALTNEPGSDTTDRTPLSERWGGWYVTGQHGDLVHLGNIQAQRGQTAADLQALRRGNLETLDGLFDTKPYLTDKSDVVALLVFEHQAYVENFITRANFKGRTLLARQAPDGAAARWASLSPELQRSFRAMLDPLVNALLFVEAAPFASHITSSSGFDTLFESRGQRDAQGRSLRDLDLQTRLFKYPVSYLVYSKAFDSLPGCAKEYVYARLAEILTGRDRSPVYAQLSDNERSDAVSILASTQPAFAAALKAE